MRESIRLTILSLLVLVDLRGQVIGFETSNPESPLEDGDPYIEVLESLALSLDPESFRQDPVLLQKLDRMNSLTKYKDAEDPRTTIYEREELDKDKEVVVLSQSQDLRFVPLSHKRTYVVLRKVIEDSESHWDSKNDLYYVTYAYIR